MNLRGMPLLVLLTALMLVIVACGEDSRSYLNEGNDLSSNGDYQEAIKQYDEAIRLDPDYAKAYFNRAYAYGELGHHELAIIDLDKAIELDPLFADAYYNRGVAYENIGQQQLAEQDFEKAEELGSDRWHP